MVITINYKGSDYEVRRGSLLYRNGKKLGKFSSVLDQLDPPLVQLIKGCL